MPYKNRLKLLYISKSKFFIRLKAIIAAIFILLLQFPQNLYSQTDNQDLLVAFPIALSDGNTEVTFEVDSTWHLVHGKISDTSGSISMENINSQQVIKVKLQFPVEKFDTDSEMRDSRMREVMDQAHFPLVKVETEFSQQQCLVAEQFILGKCKFQLPAAVTIRDTKRQVNLDITVEQTTNSLEVIGTASLLWSDYGVEDPSILIATLDPEVQISFRVKLPQKLKQQMLQTHEVH